MTSFNRQISIRFYVVISFLLATSAIASSSVEILRSEGDEKTLSAQDLINPVIGSVSLLSHLLSIPNLDETLFHQGNLTHQTSAADQHNFRATLMQMNLKLNNAIFITTINAHKIKRHITQNVSSIVKQVIGGYLKESKNSERMLKILRYLPLKKLIETTSQLTLNLSHPFEELVQLIDIPIEILTLSKSKKEQQVENAYSPELMEYELQRILDNPIETDEMKNFKSWLNEIAFKNAVEVLERMARLFQVKKAAGCIWAGKDDWQCPNNPDPFKIQLANQTPTPAQLKLENALKSHVIKEIEAQTNLLQLFNPLRDKFENLRNSWNEFAALFRVIQTGAEKILNTINKPSHWSNQFSEEMSLHLNKIENLFLVETIIDNYLEGSDKQLMETVAEIQQIIMIENLGNSSKGCSRSQNVDLDSKVLGWG